MQKKYVEGVGGYRGEIGRIKEKEKSGYIRDALRNYSSTDFKPEHIPGQIMQKAEASRRGIPQGSYTKNPDYAEIFGPTGEYINMSIGRDDITGMNRQEAERLRAKHKNVGTTYIAYNDEEVRRELNNPNVDHVIPNHASGQPVENLRRQLGDPTAKDYTGDQNETVILDKDGNRLNIKVTSKSDWDQIQARIGSGQLKISRRLKSSSASLGSKAEKPIEISDHGGSKLKYLELVSKKGVIPKFPQFLDEANYMKLIGPEYGKYGGEFPYRPATEDFNFQKAKEVLTNWSQEKPEKFRKYLQIAEKIGHEAIEALHEEQRTGEI